MVGGEWGKFNGICISTLNACFLKGFDDGYIKPMMMAHWICIDVAVWYLLSNNDESSKESFSIVNLLDVESGVAVQSLNSV